MDEFNERNFEEREVKPEGQTEKRKKKPVTRKSFVIFALVMVLLCVIISVTTGILSALVAVNVSVGGDDSATTEAPNEELISVENDTSPEVQPVEEIPTEEVTENTGTALTNGEIYDRSVPGIVSIFVTAEKDEEVALGISATLPMTANGSGFFVTADGYIVTNYHVIEGAKTVSVTDYTGKTYEAEIKGYYKSNDLAILKVEGEFDPVPLGKASALEVGDEIFAIGCALSDLSYTFTNGVVSHLNRTITLTNDATLNMYQTNIAINEGNSGGPVLNRYGEIVGITTAKYEATGVEGLSFFIPIDDVINMIDDIIDHGSYDGTPMLGVTVQPITTAMTAKYSLPQGLYIVEKESGSAAEKAGLKLGDVITAVDGEQIVYVTDLDSVLNRKRAGDTVYVTVYRDGETLTFAAQVDGYEEKTETGEYKGTSRS